MCCVCLSDLGHKATCFVEPVFSVFLDNLMLEFFLSRRSVAVTIGSQLRPTFAPPYGVKSKNVVKIDLFSSPATHRPRRGDSAVRIKLPGPSYRLRGLDSGYSHGN